MDLFIINVSQMMQGPAKVFLAVDLHRSVLHTDLCRSSLEANSNLIEF